MASSVAVLTKPEVYTKAKDIASCMAVFTKPEVYIKARIWPPVWLF